MFFGTLAVWSRRDATFWAENRPNNKRATIRSIPFRLDETRVFNKTSHSVETRRDVRCRPLPTIIYYIDYIYSTTTIFKIFVINSRHENHAEMTLPPHQWGEGFTLTRLVLPTPRNPALCRQDTFLRELRHDRNNMPWSLSATPTNIS